jgi:hypothetical protein
MRSALIQRLSSESNEAIIGPMSLRKRLLCQEEDAFEVNVVEAVEFLFGSDSPLSSLRRT